MEPNTSILDSQTLGQLFRRWLAVASIPLALATVLMLLTYLAAGPTLGLYFGGIAIFTLITPALILAEVDGWSRAFVPDAIVSAISIAWLIPVLQGTVSFGAWIGSCFVLAAYALALCSVAIALERLTRSAVAAAAITLLLSLAWLSWPIWLAAWLSGEPGQRIAALLVPPHPLFTLNGLLNNAFPVPWTQYRLAYMLTNLGDDIPYTLPTSLLPCLLLHGLAGGILLLLSTRLCKPTSKKVKPTATP